MTSTPSGSNRDRALLLTRRARSSLDQVIARYSASPLPPFRKVAAALALVFLIALNVIVILIYRVGPAIVIDGAGHGLHALDIVVLCASLPPCVILLRYLDRS